jgi:hypothetical protein
MEEEIISKKSKKNILNFNPFFMVISLNFCYFIDKIKKS